MNNEIQKSDTMPIPELSLTGGPALPEAVNIKSFNDAEMLNETASALAVKSQVEQDAVQITEVTEKVA